MRSAIRLLSIAAVAAAAAIPAARGQQPAPKPAAESPSKVESLEVTEKRTTTSERRDSTASKIVIGREEIEQYGDTNLGDVMRRLPGVTQAGRPGRGGPVRMRGMAGGYTQMLLNGERVPPGFSLEEITPDQVERIEIIRAPTAETGTRAVAGTINIVLREALRQRHNDVRIGTQVENDRYTSNASVTRNDTMGESGSYNVTVSANHQDLTNDGVVDTTYVDVPTGATALAQHIVQASATQRDGVFISSRLQWPLGRGEQFTLQPFVVANNSSGATRGRLTQDAGDVPAPYDTSASATESRYRSARFTAMLTRRLDAATSVELRGGAGLFSVNGTTNLDQFDAAGARTFYSTTVTDINDRSWNATGKLARNWGETHKATAGMEWEQTRRRESPVTIQNGEVQLAEFGSDLDVDVRRAAFFLQDEWDPTPSWATSLGLRWEGIDTKSGASADNTAGAVDNRSSVLNPLAHVVWRFDAPSRDQVRASLTQSYRSPPTQSLVARPRLNTLFPAPGPNTAISADLAGNPELKPELANGLELAFERYLAMNGVISVNLFTRRLKDVIRNVTTLETVSWAPVPRWVSRPQNLDRAVSTGVELDAKFRWDELVAGAPPVNVRANLSAFRSRVDGVPGPDNRLASQPDMTGNLGADYRFRGTPLALGGSVNWTPAYDIRQTEEQLDRVRRKVVWDAYALWHFDAATRLRLSVTTTDPRDFQASTTYLAGDQLQSLVDTRKGHVIGALRLEMRL